MSCAKPFDVAVLADYWAAALPQSEEEVIEEHLFTCNECGEHLRQVIALAEGIRNLARSGSLTMVVSDAFLKQVADQGLRIREYSPPRGGRVECTVAADDDFLIGHLSADLTRAKRVDLCLCDERGTEQIRLADIPFASEAGGVSFQQSITYAKGAGSQTMIARLVSVGDEGAEQTIGEYMFNHTRTLPGPGKW